MAYEEQPLDVRSLLQHQPRVYKFLRVPVLHLGSLSVCDHSGPSGGEQDCCLQDAFHVTVQRAAQTQVDLDQTSAMLCDEMQENARLDVSIHQVKGHLAWEREHGQLAMAAVRFLDAELRQRAYEVDTAKHELFITKVGNATTRNAHVHLCCNQHLTLQLHLHHDGTQRSTYVICVSCVGHLLVYDKL